MNVETRKLVLIQEFLRISDESFIEKLEAIFKAEKKIQHDRNLGPLSINEFHEMIDQAKSDKENGRVTSHQDLKKELKTWR